MEDGHDTRYYEGPGGRVPWMKLQGPSPPPNPENRLVRSLRLEFEMTKTALIAIFRGIKNSDD